MTRRVFVDETKARAYVLVATAHFSGELDPLRKVLRGLTLRGQSRIHMKSERDSRRQQIISSLVEAGVRADVYEATRKTEFDARYACLDRLLGQFGDEETILTLEQDDSLFVWDRRKLFEMTRLHGLTEPRFRYEHGRAATEPLLAVPDAIAWCWARGGWWRRRVDQMIVGTYHV